MREIWLLEEQINSKRHSTGSCLSTLAPTQNRKSLQVHLLAWIKLENDSRSNGRFVHEAISRADLLGAELTHLNHLRGAQCPAVGIWHLQCEAWAATAKGADLLRKF